MELVVKMTEARAVCTDQEEEVEQWQRSGATRGRGSLSVPEIKISPRLFRPCSILIPRLLPLPPQPWTVLWCIVWSFLPIRAQTALPASNRCGEQLKTFYCSFEEPVDKASPLLQKEIFQFSNIPSKINWIQFHSNVRVCARHVFM